MNLQWDDEILNDSCNNYMFCGKHCIVYVLNSNGLSMIHDLVLFARLSILAPVLLGVHTLYTNKRRIFISEFHADILLHPLCIYMCGLCLGVHTNNGRQMQIQIMADTQHMALCMSVCL